MPFPISLDQADYETLVEYARRGTYNSDGTVNQDKALALDSWLRSVEKKSGIQRYSLWLQWQEADAPLPAGTSFPEKWPPEMRHYIALVSRPIARADVEAVLSAKARTPVSVLVTRDPAGLLGWTDIDTFFK
jgi:hypothetical protein